MFIHEKKKDLTTQYELFTYILCIQMTYSYNHLSVIAFSVNLRRYPECLVQWQRFCLDVGENWPTFSLRDSFKIWSLKGGKKFPHCKSRCRVHWCDCHLVRKNQIRSRNAQNHIYAKYCNQMNFVPSCFLED